MAKQLYDYWFVQFDFPNEEGKPYKSSGGAMKWDKKLNRNIPENWHCGNLLEIAVFTNGLACQKYRPQIRRKSLYLLLKYEKCTMALHQTQKKLHLKHLNL